MKGKQVLLFDLDGTLSDSSEGITKGVQIALRHFGIEEPDREPLKRFIGPSLKAAFQGFYHFDDEQTKEAIVEYRKYYNTKGIFENRLYDGMKELLQELHRQGYTLITASSKPECYVEIITDYFGVQDCFDVLAGSELDGRRTDKQEVIRYALEKGGITDLSTVLMMGDRHFDVTGAHQAGVQVVGVSYGFGSRQELEQAGADYVVDTVAQLRELLLAK